ncbi:hypothetical protein ACFRAQ_36615 [Nocardia sp. NPDC056611]|uniref:hypothetical protein n=1 Tax=Nocardia sp. NPDC056611 TaxID=3345877 RepID=UPI00366EABE5
MTTPGLFVTRLLAAKQGNSMSECEDAVYVLPPTPFDELIDGAVTASICDGATESVLAKDWAQLLASISATRAHADPEFFETGRVFEEFAKEVVNHWGPWVDEYESLRAAQGRPLKWYEQQKLSGSTFATLLSVRVTPIHLPDRHSAQQPPSAEWRWQAAALGDSCLFHIRDDVPVQSFPVEQVEEFGTTPDLFGSRNHDSGLLTARTRFAEGLCRPGDRLLLMSDALAAWFMTADDCAAATRELLEYSGPHDAAEFSAWLGGLRARRELRNDDVALIRIDVEGR